MARYPLPQETLNDEIAAKARTITELCELLHEHNVRAGWWFPPEVDVALDGAVYRYPLTRDQWLKLRAPIAIGLIHSEISEALEGLRKNLPDDHLPHRKSVEVELADALIRIFDLAGALGLDLSSALVEKHGYNCVRQDHKPEARAEMHGKKF
jgi:NTP pyrophosphatase (non-canonical NTP hydrolase)